MCFGIIMHENFFSILPNPKRNHKKSSIKKTLVQNKCRHAKTITNRVFFRFFHEEAYLKHPPPMQGSHLHHPGHYPATDPNIIYQSYPESVNPHLWLVASETASPRISRIPTSYPGNPPLLQCTSAWHCWISWAPSPLLSWRIFEPRLLDCCTSDYSGVQ